MQETASKKGSAEVLHISSSGTGDGERERVSAGVSAMVRGGGVGVGSGGKIFGMVDVGTSVVTWLEDDASGWGGG